MLQILLEEYDRVDDRAVREKKEISYIIGLVQKNQDKLIEFSGTNNKRKLFDFTKEALKQIEKFYAPPCIGIFYEYPENLKESFSLGWIRETQGSLSYDKPPFCLTDLGGKIVDDYKSFREGI